MRMSIPDEDIEIENPSLETLLAAVKRSYPKGGNAVVYTADDEQNLFMQNCEDHIEYCVGPSGPIYAVEGISIETIIELYRSYYSGEEGWKAAVAWEVLFDEGEVG